MMTLRPALCLTLVLCACEHEEDVDPISAASDQTPPPPALDVSAVLPGSPIRLTLQGVARADVTWYASTAGPGAGPCAPTGTPCLGITSPARLGASRTDAAGTATLTVTPRALLPLGQVGYFQVIAAVGAGRAASNIVERVVGDSDLDGSVPPADCDDADNAAYPCAVEVPGDGVDQDCDGFDATAWLQVSAGEEHTCGIESGGTVRCWGDNTYGQSRPPAGSFTQVSAGGTHTCGIEVGGTVRCWGFRTAAPAGSFTQISAGLGHTCGIDVGGTVECWGYNYSGQATPPAGSFIQVSAGSFHTCGVDSGGVIRCWGDHQFGGASPPVGSFTQVSAGEFYGCGIDNGGTLQCWGLNNFGQAGTHRGTFTQVDASYRHTCGIEPGGTVRCWGDNSNGRASAPAGSFEQVSTGLAHTCGVESGGSIRCWGDNTFGQSTVPTP